jgi:L-amino acid N-acyltransferase YncA
MPHIRDFKPTDIEAITTIYTEAVLNGSGSYEIEPPTIEEMTRRFDIFVEQGFPILVAEENGSAIFEPARPIAGLRKIRSISHPMPRGRASASFCLASSSSVRQH